MPLQSLHGLMVLIIFVILFCAHVACNAGKDVLLVRRHLHAPKGQARTMPTCELHAYEANTLTANPRRSMGLTDLKLQLSETLMP